MAFRQGGACHVFAVRQRVRPDAQTVVSALQARGIAIEILSGDREPAVRAAAQTLGISEWRAGLTPADKIARIEVLKQEGYKVMMVGDGLNDAPALAAAHVSMSPISAAHLSQATADLVFLGKPLAPVVAAIDFSRKALHLMRQISGLRSDTICWPCQLPSRRCNASDRGGGDVRLLAAGHAERACAGRVAQGRS